MVNFLIPRFLGILFAGLVACAPTASPTDADADDARPTGGSAGIGVTGGASGARSGGSGGGGAGAGVATGGVPTTGGGASTGGGAGAGGAEGGTSASGGRAGETAGSGAGSGGAGASGGGAAGSAGTTSGPCGHPGEFFCEDFEDVTMLDSTRWAIEKIGEGTVVIDTSIAHSGTKSVHVTQVGYNAFATLKGASLFPENSHFYVRVFMRLATPMTAGHNTYFIAGLAAMPGAPFETRIGVMNSMLMINQPDGDRGFLSNQNFYNDGLPGAAIAANTWSCVEVFFDPPNSRIDVWLEDAPIEDLSRTDWQEERFDVVRFGFERYAGPDSEIWYDDIALGTERIGCR